MTASAELTARAAAEEILRVQVCGRAKCRCQVSARRGHGLTHCVYHDDQTPSFNVTLKGDRLLVHCALCSQRDIVQALKEMEAWPQKASAAAEVLATYDYRDADGKLLYQAIRLFPKDFRQRRPGGSPDQWINNVEGVVKVPYRLPELLALQGRTVLVLEGEKDVDRAFALGFLATCNVGGAGKWYDEYSQHLQGRSALLVPDNDEKGRQHMREVAASLKRFGIRVFWLELPGLEDKEDLSDWFDDGHTVEEFKQLAHAAGPPPPEPKRERRFIREGLEYRIDLAEAPVVLRFSRLRDRSDTLPAELHVTRADGSFLLRRATNLLASGSTVFNGIVKDLSDAELGQVDWKQVLNREFEMVLEAHRNGVQVEWTEGDLQRPADPGWLCDGLVLLNKLNCWLGAGGTGKSTLAKALMTYCAAGYRFLNRDTRPVLGVYLDYEDDKEDFDRIVHDTCRNLGVWPVPKLGWMRMKGKRLKDQLGVLTRLIAEEGVGLLVIDAVAPATGSAGERRTYDDMAVELEEALGQLPPVTVLAIDHVSAEDHKNSKQSVPAKARGGERKFEVWRNQYTLMQDQEERAMGRHVVVFHHTKFNGGALRPQLAVELVHRQDELACNVVDISASQDAIERMSKSERTLYELREAPGLKAADYALAVRGSKGEAATDSTRRELKRHSDRGQAYIDSAGNWWPAGIASTTQSVQTEPEPEPVDEQLPYWNRE